jgi:two-component system, NtrC family, nitrogen regulation sensor histidine kinase NtrY
MKLNVQHLQRSIERGDEVSNEQVKRLTANLIEQIDALTGIANAFSSFAKMPGANHGPIDLASILVNTATLYSNFDNIKLRILINVAGEAMVKSDKDQLVRVFNNLIKTLFNPFQRDKGVK